MSHGQIHFERKYVCSLRQHMYNMYLQMVYSSSATTIVCVNFVKIFIPVVVSLVIVYACVQIIFILLFWQMCSFLLILQQFTNKWYHHITNIFLCSFNRYLYTYTCMICMYAEHKKHDWSTLCKWYLLIFPSIFQN